MEKRPISGVTPGEFVKINGRVIRVMRIDLTPRGGASVYGWIFGGPGRASAHQVRGEVEVYSLREASEMHNRSVVE